MSERTSNDPTDKFVDGLEASLGISQKREPEFTRLVQSYRDATFGLAALQSQKDKELALLDQQSGISEAEENLRRAQEVFDQIRQNYTPQSRTRRRGTRRSFHRGVLSASVVAGTAALSALAFLHFADNYSSDALSPKERREGVIRPRGHLFLVNNVVVVNDLPGQRVRFVTDDLMNFLNNKDLNIKFNENQGAVVVVTAEYAFPGSNAEPRFVGYDDTAAVNFLKKNRPKITTEYRTRFVSLNSAINRSSISLLEDVNVVVNSDISRRKMSESLSYYLGAEIIATSNTLNGLSKGYELDPKARGILEKRPPVILEPKY